MENLVIEMPEVMADHELESISFTMITTSEEQSHCEAMATKINARIKYICEMFSSAKSSSHEAHEKIVALEKAALAPLEKMLSQIKVCIIDRKTELHRIRMEAEAAIAMRRAKEKWENISRTREAPISLREKRC